MKNRKFPFVGISGIFILSFIVLVLMGYTQTDNPDFTKPQEMISNLFPNSKITWSEELEGEMVNFRTTSTALAIMIGNGDKRKIEFVNFKDTTEWSIDCDKRSCRQYKMVGGDEPKLLIRGFKHGMAKTKVIDAQGEEVFDLTLKSWLSPSPSGRYYYTVDNQDSYNVLEVYDATGTFSWKREEYGGGDWFSHALSDSQLIYEDKTGCYLLNAFSGEEFWKIPRSQYRHILTWFKFIDIISSSNAKYFVLYNGDGLVSFNSEGRVLWQEKTPVRVFSAGISDDGSYISVYSGEKTYSPEKELCLMDNLRQGKILWRVSVNTERGDLTNSAEGLKIAGGIVRLIPGIVDYGFRRGITPDMQTFCFQIDPENGKLLDESIIDGVCETFETDSGRTHYLLIHKGDKKEIFRIEQAFDE